MGTNYYARFNRCECCDRYEEIHVGKSSAGWVFSFQGPSQWYREDPHPILGELTFPTSKAQWEHFLRQPGVEIWDEYDKRVDVDEFINLVESKQIPGNRNHAKEFPRYCWTDDEGYSFSGESFS